LPGWIQTSANPADIVAVSGVNVGNVNFGDHATTPPGVTPTATKDNSQLLYSETGMWSTVTGSGWNNSYRVAVSGSGTGTGANTARWILRVPPGVYEVFVTYPANSANVANAPYTVLLGSTPVASVVRNQQQLPDDAIYGGVAWKSLGVYTFSGTGTVVSVTVQLSDLGTSGRLIADGAMLVPYSGGTPQQVTAEGPGTDQILTMGQLEPVVQEAEALWRASGLSPTVLRALDNVQVFITNLPAGFVGTTSGQFVYIDARAAGYGWFVDPLPVDGRAFVVGGGEFHALPEGPAAGRIDLLTVVAHELGHVLGLQDLTDADHPGDLMAVSLTPGVRRLPPGVQVVEGLPSSAPVPRKGETSSPPAGLPARGSGAEPALVIGFAPPLMDSSRRAGTPRMEQGAPATDLSAFFRGIVLPSTPAAPLAAVGVGGVVPTAGAWQDGSGGVVLLGGQGGDLVIGGQGGATLLGGFGDHGRETSRSPVTLGGQRGDRSGEDLLQAALANWLREEPRTCDELFAGLSAEAEGAVVWDRDTSAPGIV
jgi:hypothetical protein